MFKAIRGFFRELRTPEGAIRLRILDKGDYQTTYYIERKEGESRATGDDEDDCVITFYHWVVLDETDNMDDAQALFLKHELAAGGKNSDTKETILVRDSKGNFKII